jgi:endonuclease III|tara:strand:+ start:1915 stop:2319 length:405 start_codon:yes stop_codon:yes gene_type:complete
MRDDLMVQQQVETVWQHMVGVICLNCTGRKQVKKVLPILFTVAPTPVHFLNTPANTVKSIIESLGMVNIRYNRLKRMSNDFLTWDGEDATMLHGIGKYGSDSYRLFYKREVPDNIGDHELKRYVEEEFYDLHPN